MSFFRLQIGFILSLAIFTSTVIPSNVQAASTQEYKMEISEVHQELDNIFDRFHYAITVEWDQKDEAFRKAAEKELSDGLEASGVSAAELENYIATKILSGSAGKEFKRLISALKEQDLAPTTAAQLGAEFMKQTYAEGTNFYGEGGPHGNKWTVVIIVVVVVVVTHWLLKKHYSGKDHDHDHDEDDGDTVIIIVD